MFFHGISPLVSEGNSVKDLAYKTPLYPFVPIASFVLCLASVIGIAFDEGQRVALYCTIPFVGFCYIAYYVTNYVKKKRSEEYVNTSETQSH